MLTLGAFVSLTYYLVAVLLLQGVCLTLSYLFRREAGSKPLVRYKDGSVVCEAIVEACSTLRENYIPPLLWGTSGHVQTILFGVIGRFQVPCPQGSRHCIPAPDGSTVIYDVFEPNQPSGYTFIVCPGIAGTSESDYIRTFVDYVTHSGFRVAVLNHVGALRDSTITGKRIFTYGGTGDLALMFEDLLLRYHDNKFIALGFSLGGNIIVRFVGEREKWRKQYFICAISVCQGYDPNMAVPKIRKSSKIIKFYLAKIVSKQLKLLHRHRHSLFGHETQQHLKDPKRRHSDVTHSGYDCNGFSLDPEKISHPDEGRLWRAKSVEEMDEYYTRRVLGFESVHDLYKWSSCVDLMHQVTDFPFLLLNSCDDPVIPTELHSIPLEYTDRNPCAMFVCTQHGGHLGFFEGGVIRANPVCWMDRCILEYSRACIELTRNHNSTSK